MCPGIRLVEGRHELYVKYHHRIVEAVGSCIPVAIIASIDEMACQLMGRERPVSNALQLGAKIKQNHPRTGGQDSALLDWTCAEPAPGQGCF